MSVFVDIEEKGIISETPEGNQSINTGALAIGNGSQVFRADRSGLWLGASAFTDAPFSVNMAGDVIATSITVSGYIAVGGAGADVNSGAVSISADKINISGSTTFSSGYDPADKLDEVGGRYNSAASGARVRIFPDSDTGLQVIDDSGDTVFKALVGGTNVGDVEIGDYGSNKGLKWDKRSSTFTVKGSLTMGSGSTLSADYITAGTLTGRTVRTASSDKRVEISGTDNSIKIYNTGGNLCGTIQGGSGASGYLTLGGAYNTYITSGQLYVGDGSSTSWIRPNGGNLTLANTGDTVDCYGNMDVLGWGSFGGDVDMNSNKIYAISHLDMDTENKGEHDENGSFYYYEDDGDYFFGSNNDGWEGKFSQSAQ